MNGHSEDISTLGLAVAGLIEQNKELAGQVDFLKSEMAKLGALPATEKKPVMGQGDVRDLGLVAKDRGEVIALIRKGIADKQLTSEDMLAYEVKGAVSDKAQQYIRLFGK